MIIKPRGGKNKMANLDTITKNYTNSRVNLAQRDCAREYLEGLKELERPGFNVPKYDKMPNNIDDGSDSYLEATLDYPRTDDRAPPGGFEKRVPIWNFREWEILSWCKARINDYKLDKGNRRKRGLYEEAKEKWKEVMDGKYSNEGEPEELPEFPHCPFVLGYALGTNKLSLGQNAGQVSGIVIPVRWLR